MDSLHPLRSPSQEKYKILAQQNGWSPAYAQGYVEGELARISDTKPAHYAVVGIDEYCLGFRAGYFANARCSSIATVRNKIMALENEIAPQFRTA
ncbi:MAG TPA: hypothetical protein VK663_02375 [Burkholderiales bacterium]|nr:hypothetical protein [Burkholderiales bacterium]